MSDTNVVTLYNPANASTLTPEQIQGLQNLTIAQIHDLARAYPNSAMQRAYLMIIDKSKPVSKQLPSLSTFENLYNLITRNGMKNYVAWAFKGNVKPVVTRAIKRRTEVLDLQDAELMHLPGFKADKEMIPPETVPIVKVPKVEKAVQSEPTEPVIEKIKRRRKLQPKQKPE